MVIRKSWLLGLQQRGVKQQPTRATALAYLILLAISIAAVVLCVKIIQSDNVFYQASGGCACGLALAAWCYVHYRRSRRGHIAHHIDETGPRAVPVDVEVRTDQAKRASLRQFYGDSVDSVLIGGPGLAPEVVETILRPFEYTEGRTKRQKYNSGSAPEGVTGKGTICEKPGQRCTVCSSLCAVGDEVVGLPCHHIFHRHCVVPHLRVRNRCPLCQELAVRIEALVDHMDSELALCGSHSRCAELTESSLSSPPVPSDSSNAAAALDVPSGVSASSWLAWAPWAALYPVGASGPTGQRRPPHRSLKSVSPLIVQAAPSNSRSAAFGDAVAPARPHPHRSSSTTSADTFASIL
jgi:hypothetical protein